ncbi:MAG: aspartate--ammonia ligase [Paludibacteraceae bacterium]|nr:aspartate--ammonia ligase [Paludibacteraceae bacterium]MBR4705551.1 aspartate--ammonia ligase [Paludibacteraceae bacterium]
MNVQETEHAIKLVKDTFQLQLSAMLRLRRVTAPLFVESGTGLNDDLTGVEQPVRFYVPALGKHCEIVHSLAKWKRMKLWHMNAPAGYGIYTDMNALRTFETPDDIHSLYVDQWDWEKVLTRSDRTPEYLYTTVRQIYNVLLNTEFIVCEHYAGLKPFLPKAIHFVTSEELVQRYPGKTAKEREEAVCREYGAVFIHGIGAPLSDGKPHDSRASDYDDWTLNGDILVWYPVLDKPIELSSMGIRVDAQSMRHQLEQAGHSGWAELEYHSLVLNNTLPLTIGGGIGQSRLCMVLLHKRHIGEVQVSEWSDETVAQCRKEEILLLQ